MGDNVDQNRVENMQRLQQNRPIIPIRTHIRQKVLAKIIDFLKGRCKQPDLLPGVENIARKFEEKIVTIAKDEQDYLRRISNKMKSFEASSERPANALPAVSASGGPNQLQSASGNVQPENIKQDQQKVVVQSQNSSQRQPRQIINSNSTVMTAAAQVSGTHITSQNTNLMNISRTPPNLEKKVSEQLTPSNQLAVATGQKPILHPQQPLQRQHVKPLSNDHVVQCQSLNQHPNRGNTQQHQNIQKQLTPSPQAISRVTIKPEQPEISSACRYQSVTKQQYESWQRDNAQQRKSVPTQQKSMLGTSEANQGQSSAYNNQQNVSHLSSVPIVGQQQPRHLASPHPQRSMPGRTAQEELKQQPVQPHVVPLVQPRAQQISQQKTVVVKEEKDCTSGAISMSQNVPSSETRTIPLGSLPSEASKRIDDSVAVARHVDTDGWTEGIHQRILAMKRKYQTAMVDVNSMLNDRFKLLDMHPNTPNKDVVLKRLKDAKVMVVRIIKFLNLTKEQILPVHGEKLKQWEDLIVNYLSKFIKSNIAAVPPSVQPSKPQVQPTNEVRNVGSQPDQVTQHVQPQKNVAGSSLPVSRDGGDNLQAQTQPPTSVSPSSVLVDRNDATKDLGNNSQIVLSDQRTAEQSPIERLLKAVNSMSPQAFKSGMEDIFTVTRFGDVMESSAPRSTSKTNLSAVGQDLGAMTGCRLQARMVSLRDGGSGTRTWTSNPRLTTPTTSGICNDRDTSDQELTFEKIYKRRRLDPHKILSEEIRKVNQKLIDIAVEICNEEADLGIVVKCCYTGVSVNLGIIKSIVPSGNTSVIQPLRFLVPAEYPDCSPVILDTLPSESGDICEAFSDKARARLDILLRGLDSPFSVSEVARKWELCARDVIIEYAQMLGGGTFSSRFGAWESCMDIA